MGTAPQKEECILPMFTVTPCRDRYEGQLNEFLLENKNLKEQLTTLKVVCLEVETLMEKLLPGSGVPVDRGEGGGARFGGIEGGARVTACFRKGKCWQP